MNLVEKKVWGHVIYLFKNIISAAQLSLRSSSWCHNKPLDNQISSSIVPMYNIYGVICAGVLSRAGEENCRCIETAGVEA